MQGRYKYQPSKTALTMQELKANLSEAQEQLKKAVGELGEVQAALKWTRDKLIEVEDENRNLKLMILRLNEERDGKNNG